MSPCLVLLRRVSRYPAEQCHHSWSFLEWCTVPILKNSVTTFGTLQKSVSAPCRTVSPLLVLRRAVCRYSEEQCHHVWYSSEECHHFWCSSEQSHRPRYSDEQCRGTLQNSVPILCRTVLPLSSLVYFTVAIWSVRRVLHQFASVAPTFCTSVISVLTNSIQVSYALWVVWLFGIQRQGCEVDEF